MKAPEKTVCALLADELFEAEPLVLDIDDAESNVRRIVTETGFLGASSERRAKHVARAIDAMCFLAHRCKDQVVKDSILSRAKDIIASVWHIECRKALGFKEHAQCFWTLVLEQAKTRNVEAAYGEESNPPGTTNRVVIHVRPSQAVETYVFDIRVVSIAFRR